jgi:glycosyltransferase involved in cell wall biosynthesis
MSRPLVAVDATLVGARSKGAGRALKNLLAAFPTVEPGLRFVALATQDGAAVLEQAAPGVDIERVEAGSGTRWELDGAGRAAASVGAELLFTVRELSPRTGPPAVVHVYEPPVYRLRGLGIRDLAESKRVAKDLLLHLALRRSLARAAAVTAGSATTAAWLREHAGVEAVVVRPGIDPAFQSATVSEPDGAPYALHPSTGDPRENTPLVLEAFARADAPPLRLKLVGLPDAQRSRLEQRVRALGIADRVDLLGWVTDEELRALYAGAIALLHPTRYESFAGFPALEAIALGTPVVALDAPGSTEALEGAALLLSGEDPALLAAELRRLMETPALRATLSERGRVLAAGLTWEASAASLTAVFRSVLG